MRVIASAADPYSFMNLMGIKDSDNYPYNTAYKYLHPGGYTSSVTNLCSLLDFSSNSNYLFPTPPISVDVTGETEIFIKIHLYNMYDSTDSSYSSPSGDGRKLIKIYNTSNTLLYSIGFNISTKLSSASDKYIYLYTYDANGNIITSVKTGYSLPFYQAEVYLNRPIFIHLKIDNLVPSNSFLKFYKESVLMGSILGDLLHINPTISLKDIRLRDNMTSYYTGGIPDYYHLNMTEFIVTNYANFTIKAFPLKPSSLTANNQFFGVVGNISSWMQDKLYINSPNEVNTSAEFLLTRPSGSYGSSGNSLIQGIDKIVKLDNYMFGRYVQDGGTSVDFGVKLSNDYGNISAEKVVTIPANQDDNYYLTKHVDSTVCNLDVNDLINIKSTIEILGG